MATYDTIMLASTHNGIRRQKKTNETPFIFFFIVVVITSSAKTAYEIAKHSSFLIWRFSHLTGLFFLLWLCQDMLVCSVIYSIRTMFTSAERLMFVLCLAVEDSA